MIVAEQYHQGKGQRTLFEVLSAERKLKRELKQSEKQINNG